MKFKFIHSKKGYGKTKYIFEDISKSFENNIIIFVPSHNTFMIENRLIDYFGEEIFSRVEVMDFKKLTSRLLNVYKGFKTKRISDIGKNLLINYILRNNNKNLKYFNVNNRFDFSDDILSMLIDFKNFNFKDSMINEVLHELEENNELYKKLHDFKFINNIYEKYLNEKYLDPLDEMIIVNSIIKNDKNIFSGYKFYIDGFEILTYYQYEFLKIIIERTREINLSLTLDKNQDSLIYSHIKTIKDKILKILFDKKCYDIEEIFLENVNKDKELKYLDENYLDYKCLTYKDEPKNIFINKCLNNFYEVEELCKNIRRVVRQRGYRYKDIGVLCRDIDSYENFIRVSFDEFNIPYFIDKKNDIKSNIFVNFLTSIFEIFNYNFSYVSLFKYIKSGLINLTFDEIFLIENFALENGITGYKWKEEFKKNTKIKYSMKKLENDFDEELDYINSIRDRIVSPLLKLFNKVKDKNNVNYFIIEFYNFLENNSIVQNLYDMCKKFTEEKNFIYADELNQTINDIFNVFDEINNVFKDEVMSFSEFGEILMDSISKIEISHVPMRVDEVMIGDVSRLMIGDYKALFVIGCISSNFPKSYKKEDLLSDMDKKYLRNKGIELSGTNVDKNLSERYLMYSIINISREFLYLSYPISDMNSMSLSPSIMISKIKYIFPHLIEKNSNIISKEFSLEDISSKKATLNNLVVKLREDFNNNKSNEVLISLYNFYKNHDKYSKNMDVFFDNLNFMNSCEKLNTKLIDHLYYNSKFSISSIETYAKCSFKYFIDYIIRVKRRKIYSFDPLDCGNFMHFLMENICKDINKLYDFKNASREEIKKFVDSYFEKNIFCDENENYILNTSFKFKVFGVKIKKIINDSIFFTARHLLNSEFFHKFYEFEIGNKKSKIQIEVFEGKKVEFVGKIDRVDFCTHNGETFVNIVDYKSSVRSFDYGKIYQNLNIQTIAYMKYILEIYKNIYEESIIPCGIFYFTLHSPNIKNKYNLDLHSEIQKNYKYEGIFTNDINKLMLIDKNLFDNTSNILPLKVNKNGEFYKNASSDRILNDDEFSDLLEFVNNSIKAKLKKIFSGDFYVYPILETYSSKKCTNCDYLGVCKFSKNINSFEVLSDLDKIGFFDLIKRRT